MKTIYFENIRNKEQFYCKNVNDIQTIEGVEYIRVFRVGTNREALVKKESLRKVDTAKQ